MTINSHQSERQSELGRVGDGDRARCVGRGGMITQGTSGGLSAPGFTPALGRRGRLAPRKHHKVNVIRLDTQLYSVSLLLLRPSHSPFLPFSQISISPSLSNSLSLPTLPLFSSLFFVSFPPSCCSPHHNTGGDHSR